MVDSFATLSSCKRIYGEKEVHEQIKYEFVNRFFRLLNQGVEIKFFVSNELLSYYKSIASKINGHTNIVSSYFQ